MTNKNIAFYDKQPKLSNFKDEVMNGFAQEPKVISPKFFYDKRGSELFHKICSTPEYYPTRTEINILHTYANEIASLAGKNCMLIELGSGASKKVRLLLDVLKPIRYMGIDISKEYLIESTEKLAADYPWLTVEAMCTDFSHEIIIPNTVKHIKKLAFFPGSSIGNFEPKDAINILQRIKQTITPNGALIIGVDLKKDPAVLNAAYNDNAGITAEFNLNLLKRINIEFDCNIKLDNFQHKAFYNTDKGRVEMHLVSKLKQAIKFENKQFELQKNESIHTENSYKYSIEEFSALSTEAGYKIRQVWTDENKLFSVYYLEV